MDDGHAEVHGEDGQPEDGGNDYGDAAENEVCDEQTAAEEEEEPESDTSDNHDKPNSDNKVQH